MTYYSDQVAASRRAIADALSGKRLRDSIRQLQERSRVTDSLKSLQARGALTSKKKIGRRSIGSVTARFVEQSRTFHDELRTIRSTDGIFSFEFYNTNEITMTDGTVFKYLDYDPNATG